MTWVEVEEKLKGAKWLPSSFKDIYLELHTEILSLKQQVESLENSIKSLQVTKDHLESENEEYYNMFLSALSWSPRDVIERAEEMKISLSIDQAYDILKNIFLQHGGINDNVLNDYIKKYGNY